MKNTASDKGAGIYDGSEENVHTVARIINCTFFANAASGRGGGICHHPYTKPEIRNCILWNDMPEEIFDDSGSLTVTYSAIQGGYPGIGNIDLVPSFIDAYNPDLNTVNLRLMSVSPCIDAGDSTAIPVNISLDLDNNQRGVDAPANPDTGISVLGMTVDMGAYEFQPCPIPGDINCDGVVDIIDLSILASHWLEKL
jgi:hypothetical protein